MSFKAKLVTIDDTPDICALVVGFNEPGDGTGTSILLMRGHAFSAQARRAGLDTYSISTDIGLNSYGGVLSVTLTKGMLELLVAKKICEELGFHRLMIEFDIDDEKLTELRKALRGIFPPNDRPRKFAV